MTLCRYAFVAFVALPGLVACSGSEARFDASDGGSGGNPTITAGTGNADGDEPKSNAGGTSAGTSSTAGTSAGGANASGTAGDANAGSSGDQSGGTAGSETFGGAGGASGNAGSAGAPQAGQGGGAGSSPTGPHYEVTSTMFALDYIGSPTGGVAFAATGCAAGDVMVGFAINRKADSGPYKLTPRCAQVRPNGTLSSIKNATTIAGNLEGPLNESFDCPANSIAYGVYGYVDVSGTPIFISRLGLLCNPLIAWVDQMGGGTAGPLLGLESGTKKFTQMCPMGFALRSFSGRVGNLFDGLQGHCVKIVKQP